ncbi:MAG: sulfite exporter TauE/SafE family protein [Ignavibacteriales bacterium]|nr:sulfite exporter TauE/SafE family protein [Ignavibacteriales bacterium]
MVVITGFIFGILGGLHCIGMCGPIVLALPVGEQSAFRFASGRALYHFGRVISYAVMGAAVGLLGARLLLPILQQNLSIIVGALLILTVLFPKIIRSVNFLSKVFDPVTQKITSIIGKMLESNALVSMLILGVMNGFLPCGFVYMAISTAAVTGGSLAGMLFMVGFGLGTVPAMLAVSFFPKLISANLRLKIAKILPAFQVIIGLLLIIRGLNLGIPYLSPKLAKMIPTEGGECCN